MHKDQERIKDVLLPQVVDRVHDETPEAERDCTVLNRLLIQGPDPLFLMEAAPAEFAHMCRTLDIEVSWGKNGVEAAHWGGPGIFFDGDIGLDPETDPNTLDLANTPLRTLQEIVWLLLADASDCTEVGYSDEVSMVERVRRASTAISRVTRLADKPLAHLVAEAISAMQKFIDTTEVRFDAEGRPHATEDHSFYVLYKQGYKAAAVHTKGGTTFWGTVPGTSLEEQGIEVAKQISPQFGLVFGDDSWDSLSPSE